MDKVLMSFLDAVSDDAYGIAELWSITRGPGVSEETARQRARDALIELFRLGYVEFLLEPEPGIWHELGPDEIQQMLGSDELWGISGDATPLTVAATAKGKELLKRQGGMT